MSTPSRTGVFPVAKLVPFLRGFLDPQGDGLTPEQQAVLDKVAKNVRTNA